MDGLLASLQTVCCVRTKWTPALALAPKCAKCKFTTLVDTQVYPAQFQIHWIHIYLSPI